MRSRITMQASLQNARKFSAISSKRVTRRLKRIIQENRRSTCQRRRCARTQHGAYLVASAYNLLRMARLLRAPG